ncbi:ASML-like protein [Mya arenaria]|uniref:ASML-like protein n=1 Tax=Mya arenaria TaxID=6604 RepID=A0ABY7DSD5_MYAAR|nr:ASML-like protein [Mya arenaria]
MLQPILKSLNSKRIVLASSSPRRKTLLQNIGLKFEVIPSNFEENLKKDTFSSPLAYVNETAKQKMLDVVHRLYKQDSPPDLIIGADTIVTMENEIFEKPASREHATEWVFTSVVLATPSEADPGYALVQFHAETEVNMGDLAPEIIQAYVDTGEPMDKAGGYGIQALGCNLISGINGDYFNVIGFPLHQFSKELLKLFPISG